MITFLICCLIAEVVGGGICGLIGLLVGYYFGKK